MTWSMFLPLLVGGIALAVISAVAGVMDNRGNSDRAERWRDYGFLLMLAFAAWTVILLIVAIFNKPNSVGDMLTIILVVVVFFALLLLVFFGISLLVGALGRRTDRRRRVTTDEL
jgi:Kef-type K+ transport system membrane component KefB